MKCLRTFLFLGLSLWLLSARAAEPTEKAPATAAAPSAVIAPSNMEKNVPVHKLSLNQSIQMAIQSSTAVMHSKNDLDYNGTALLQSYAQFLPNLQLTGADQYYNGTSLVTTTTPAIVKSKNTSLNYQVSSDLNIFNGFADVSQMRSAQLKKKAAELTLTRAEQQIAIDVTQSYLQVVLDHQIEDIAEANLKASNDRLAYFRAQKKSGIIAVVDLYREEAQASADGLYLIQSRVKTKDDMLLLIRKLRLDTKDNYVLENPNLNPQRSSNSAGAEQDLIEQAVKNRPDLASSQSLQDAYDWDVKHVDGDYFPKLDLVGTFGGNGRYYYQQIVGGVDVTPAGQDGLVHQVDHQTEWTLGLNLTWSIFDRLVTTTRRAEAVEIQRNAQIDYEDLHNQVISEVRQALNDLRSAEDQVSTSQVGVASAAKALQALQARFRVGMSNFIDLETSQAAYVQAQASQAQAIVNRYMQSKTLELVTGQTPDIYQP